VPKDKDELVTSVIWESNANFALTLSL